MEEKDFSGLSNLNPLGSSPFVFELKLGSAEKKKRSEEEEEEKYL